MGNNGSDFNFDAIRSLPDAALIEFLNSLYAEGYLRGHHLTVEGDYVDVSPSDKGAYFFDEVSDYVIHYFPRQTPKLLCARDDFRFSRRRRPRIPENEF